MSKMRVVGYIKKQANRGEVKANWSGKIIAESEQTIEVGGYHYFPRASVRMEMLRHATKTARDLECPHGVQFYDLVDAGKQGERLAWSYEAPRASMRRVDHWIGFWRDVSLEP
jgi:uncharacterized protein (DUF427 family)